MSSDRDRHHGSQPSKLVLLNPAQPRGELMLRRRKKIKKFLRFAAGVSVSPNEQVEPERRDSDPAIYETAGVTKARRWSQESSQSGSARGPIHPEQTGLAHMKALPSLPPTHQRASRRLLQRKDKTSEIRDPDSSGQNIEGSQPAEFDPATLPEVMQISKPFSHDTEPLGHDTQIFSQFPEPFSVPFQSASTQKTESEETSTEHKARLSGDNQHSRESQELQKSLDRMHSLLRDGKVQSPSIQFSRDIIYPCTLEAVEMALRDLLVSYRSIYRKLDAAELTAETSKMKYESLRAVHNNSAQNNKELTERISVLQAEYAEKASKIGNLEGRLEALTEQHNAQEEKHDSRVRKIQEDHRAEKDALLNGHRRLEGQITKDRHTHMDEIHRLKEQHSQQLTSNAWSASQLLDETKRNAKDELASTKRAAADKLAELTKYLKGQEFQAQDVLKATADGYELQIKNMSTQHNNNLQQAAMRAKVDKDQLEIAHREKLGLLEGLRQRDRGDFKTQLEAKDQEIRTLKETKSAEIQKLKDEYEDERSEIRTRHDRDKVAIVRGIKETMETLKEALVNRDKFKAMSDHELKYRFEDISVEVDEFARVEWDKGRELSWPFPSRSLRTSGNERRTKKCLIQNTLWVILYERIFCTPFRVLGTEGLSLENEWREKYGEDPDTAGELAHCPRPTEESEKWRYETMKKCVEATSQSVSEEDSSYNLKRGYAHSLKEAGQEILHELEKVTRLSGNDKQRMDDLVKKAAELWLEVGQQRCRMFLLMSQSDARPARSRQDHNGPLDLVVVPELRRMGNAQGEQLDKNELVMDCKGKFSVFSAS